jgi:hypothetical protein
MLAGMNKSQSARERWRGIVEQQRTSGLNVAAYCRQTRVPASSFLAWRRKLSTRSHVNGGAKFAEVRVATARAGQAPAGEVAALEVRLPGRRGIFVRPGFDPQTLRELLAILEAGA